MSNYTTYQCNLCRRTKDLPTDNVRVTLGNCIITKGCQGHLFKIGTTTSPSVTPSVSGLTDWYARGTNLDFAAIAAADVPVLMSTSSTGVVTVAIKMTEDEVNANNTLHFKFSERKSDAISYQDYLFKITSSTAVVSGKDISGKNLRFDQTAIDESRIFVRVNGISKFATDDFVLTPNTVTFNANLTVGSTVDVIVYSEKTATEKSLDFEAHKSRIIQSTSGAWGNVNYLRKFNPDGTLGTDKWFLYSCTLFMTLSAPSNLMLTAVNTDFLDPVLNDYVEIPFAKAFTDMGFLMAAYPYENVDRYLDFFIPADALSTGYNVSSLVTNQIELSAIPSVIQNVYPPMVLDYNDSFLQEDVFPTSGTVQTDTSAIYLKSKKIFGPS